MSELATFEGALNMFFAKFPEKVKELNEARKRSEMDSIKLLREWSDESMTIREIKSGLYTWFRDRDINDKSKTLTILLNEYITTIYDNEIAFVEKFLPEFIDYIELYEVYFASERVKLVIINDDGSHVSTSVKTTDVCDWIETLN